jgi:hypothetical protein
MSTSPIIPRAHPETNGKPDMNFDKSEILTFLPFEQLNTSSTEAKMTFFKEANLLTEPSMDLKRVLLPDNSFHL